MNLNKNLLLFGGILGILLLGAITIVLLTFKVSPVSAAQSVLNAVTLQDDDDDDPGENGDVEEAGESEETGGGRENEPGDDDAFTGSVPVSAGQRDLQSLAKITSEQAGKIAQDAILRQSQDANQGTHVTEVELEAENGYLVYEVEMDNGIEVVVDAGNGEILHSEQDAILR